MLNLDPQIYPPEKINLIKNFISRNLLIEALLLAGLFIIRKTSPKYLSFALIWALILELFIFATGNIFTTHISNLTFNPDPLAFQLDRYISTSDVLDYLGLQVYWNHLRVRQPFAPDLSRQETQTFNRLRQEITMLPGNINLVYPIFNASGYSAVVLDSYANFFNSQSINSIKIKDLTDKKLQDLGVNYIVSGFPDDYAKDLTGFKKVSDSPNIYQSLTHHPRVTLGSNNGSVEITSYQPQEISLIAKSSQPDSLLLMDSFYPGWKATVNNLETTISPYKQTFRAINIPPGTSRITFSYQPQSVKIGAIISLISIITAFAFIKWPNQKLLS